MLGQRHVPEKPEQLRAKSDQSFSKKVFVFLSITWMNYMTFPHAVLLFLSFHNYENIRMLGSWGDASPTCSHLWPSSSTILFSWSLRGCAQPLGCLQQREAGCCGLVFSSSTTWLKKVLGFFFFFK